MKTTDIDALSGVAGRAKIFGEEHDVLDLNAEEFKTEGIFDDMDRCLDVVERIVPTVPRAQLNKLTPKQLGAIFAVAAGAVKDVEDEFPNGSSPATSTTDPG